MQLLDINKLQTFVVLAQLRNFTKTARKLKLTQPTVSQQMATLEKMVGVPLIVRQPRDLQLTDAGKTLLGYAERLLALSNEALQNTREVAELTDRTLHLGVGHTLAIYLLPELLHQLRQHQPELAIRIQAGNTADLLTATADGSVELALVGSPAKHSALRITPFMDDELVVIIPNDDSWVGLPNVELADLYKRPLFTREDGSALHASVQKVLGAEHFKSNKVIKLGETEAIKRSVEAGLGIALIQKIAIQRELTQGILKTVPLASKTLKRTYNVVRRRNEDISLAGQLLLRLLLKK